MRALLEPMRFAAVGLAATAVHVAVGLSLERFAGLQPWSANLAAFAIALLVSYFGNSLITFRVDPKRSGAFARFGMMSLAAFVMNQTIVMVLTGLGWSYAGALVVVVLTVPAATYLLSKYWALK